MKVAIFTETYHQINGVAMVYNRFARWCGKHGYDIEIFTPGEEDTIEFGNVKVHSIPMIFPIKYYRNLKFDLFPFRKKLTNYFRQNNFDLVHMATQGHMGILALTLAKKFKLPIISCYHTAIPEYARDRAIQIFGKNFVGNFLAKNAFSLSWWFQKILFGKSKMILVPTKSIDQEVKERMDVPTALFTRGVNNDEFSPEQRTHNGNTNPITLYAGRISIEKNLELLEKLDLPRGKNMRFVGDGPYTKTLRKNLPGAEFTGFLTGLDLQHAYADADIFVFPSKTDTFGNVVLEAMASGLPAVVTDVLGPKDFVRHGETGFIASSDEEFVNYHRQLVQDDELRKKMGRNAREYALTCNWDTIFETQVIENYRKILGESR